MKRLVLISILVLLVSVSCFCTLPFTLLSQFLANESLITANPTVEPIVCNNDSCLQACLQRIQSVLQGQNFNPLTDYAGLDARFDMVIYDASDGQLGEPTILYVPEDYKQYQEDTKAQLRVWNYASALLPADQMKWITQYLVYTDGPYNELAYVSAQDDTRKAWTLGTDILDSSDPITLTETLVHEFAHMVMLNSDQIPENANDYSWKQGDDCATFRDIKGCTNPDSYINQFYEAFWKDTFGEWKRTVIDSNIYTVQDEDALVQKFYDAHRNLFFKEYAATNIEEDMAVTFEHFVMEPMPSGDAVLARKILFYYNFPELVELRQSMIHGMCAYTAE
jgi:hypothetical protein